MLQQKNIRATIKMTRASTTATTAMPLAIKICGPPSLGGVEGGEVVGGEVIGWLDTRTRIPSI